MLKLRLGRQNRGAFERGQAVVEFGIVALAFFILVMGIFDMTRMFQSWVAVQHAAREGARYAITGRTDCQGTSGREECILWTAKDATVGIFGGGPNGSDVVVTTKAWDFDTYSGTGAGGEAGNECDQVEVTVSYKHHFVTPVLEAIAPSGVSIKGSQRMTNEPFTVCKKGDGVG